MCYYDKDVTAHLKVHEVIKGNLLEHPNDTKIVTVLIALLRYCSHDNENEIIHGGCLQCVVHTAMKHRSSPLVQLNTMLFLQDLTAELTDTCTKRVLQSKAVACATQAVTRHWKSEPIVQASLAVVTNIFQYQEGVNSEAATTALKGLKGILLRSIMKKSRTPATVVAAFNCLLSLAMDRGDVKKIIVESGLIARTTEIMESFGDSAEVQRSAADLLEYFN